MNSIDRYAFYKATSMLAAEIRGPPHYCVKFSQTWGGLFCFRAEVFKQEQNAFDGVRTDTTS